ncbi:hypothetical protein AOLI_G00106880 [Acnodon oligacanthus]
MSAQGRGRALEHKYSMTQKQREVVGGDAMRSDKAALQLWRRDSVNSNLLLLLISYNHDSTQDIGPVFWILTSVACAPPLGRQWHGGGCYCLPGPPAFLCGCGQRAPLPSRRLCYSLSHEADTLDQPLFICCDTSDYFHSLCLPGTSNSIRPY